MTTASTIDYAALMAAPDRTEGDRALDAKRKPAELLSFLGLQPGMKVAELIAGFGYTTELLARAVGPTGVVYGQNPPIVIEMFAAKPWSERLARPANKVVVRVDRELTEPFPPEVKDLDLVLIFGHYHDISGGLLNVDRPRMNGAVFAALKRGGHYVVIDSSARPGAGAGDAAKLHRVEESFVQREVEAAGFKLERSGDLYRNPADTRDWDSNPMAGAGGGITNDRFALSFVKP